MIEGDFIYIDKTSYIYDLIKGKAYFLLSRPRRFGKTLLVSTMQEIFLGNRELFKGLKIDSTDYSWHTYPVVIISFATMAIKSADVLRQALDKTLKNIAKRYDVEIEDEPTLGMRFKSLILALAKKGKVVILIDEYDTAILKNLEDFNVADACREVLGEFFSALKDLEVDKQLRFVFITGITKFSKTSIFSGLNNLQDLSLDPRAAKLLGYTSTEIETNYSAYLEDLSQTSGTSQEEILDLIKFWYNGYQFVNPTLMDAKVYNPYSVMLYLQNREFDTYWFDTGTPTFLMKLLKLHDYPILTIDGAKIHKSETKSYDIKEIKLLPLLWQAGYLTIESYNPKTKNYKLKLPNEEIKVSFLEHVMESLSSVKPSILSSIVSKLSQALQVNDLDQFFETLKSFFSKIPYDLHIPSERYYQSLFFTTIALIESHITAEDRTNNGRIDAVIETLSHVYIFEFKIHDTAQAALAQIQEKEYYKKFLLDNKKIILVGVQFDTDKRTIAKWLSEELATPS